MAFRATNSTQARALEDSKNIAAQLKANMDGFIVQMQATNTDYARLEAIYSTLVRADEGLKNNKGIVTAEYAREMENDPGYDVVTEALAMEDEIEQTITWMDTNTTVTNRTLKPPADWLDARTIVLDEFTPAEIQPLINRLQGVSDAIV